MNLILGWPTYLILWPWWITTQMALIGVKSIWMKMMRNTRTFSRETRLHRHWKRARRMRDRLWTRNDGPRGWGQCVPWSHCVRWCVFIRNCDSIDAWRGMFKGFRYWCPVKNRFTSIDQSYLEQAVQAFIDKCAPHPL